MKIRSKPLITKQEYNDVRLKFIEWAESKDMIVGNDEMGYNWDDEEGAAAWEAWKYLVFGDREYKSN